MMNSAWFRQALNRVNATQADLARHLRLTPSAVSRMMKGERQMKQLEPVHIAEFLGVSPEDSCARTRTARLGAVAASVATRDELPSPARKTSREVPRRAKKQTTRCQLITSSA